jgi:hypothetical protein
MRLWQMLHASLLVTTTLLRTAAHASLCLTLVRKAQQSHLHAPTLRQLL